MRTLGTSKRVSRTSHKVFMKVHPKDSGCRCNTLAGTLQELFGSHSGKMFFWKVPYGLSELPETYFQRSPNDFPRFPSMWFQGPNYFRKSPTTHFLEDPTTIFPSPSPQRFSEGLPTTFRDSLQYFRRFLYDFRRTPNDFSKRPKDLPGQGGRRRAAMSFTRSHNDFPRFSAMYFR